MWQQSFHVSGNKLSLALTFLKWWTNQTNLSTRTPNYLITFVVPNTSSMILMRVLGKAQHIYTRTSSPRSYELPAPSEPPVSRWWLYPMLRSLLLWGPLTLSLYRWKVYCWRIQWLTLPLAQSSRVSQKSSLLSYAMIRSQKYLRIILTM